MRAVVDEQYFHRSPVTGASGRIREARFSFSFRAFH
jgi:hypothetical protein